MKTRGEKLKGFAVGMSMAGIAVLTAAAPQAAQRACTGACAGCYACGLTALPLVLWLAGKRWSKPKSATAHEGKRDF